MKSRAGPDTGGEPRATKKCPYFFCFSFPLSSSPLFFFLSLPSPSPFTPIPSSLSAPPPGPLSALSQLSSALLFDAVYAVVTAVQELNRSQEIGVKPLSCGSAQIWQHGTSLMNYLRMVRGGRGPAGRGGDPRVGPPPYITVPDTTAIYGDPVRCTADHICPLILEVPPRGPGLVLCCPRVL